MTDNSISAYRDPTRALEDLDATRAAPPPPGARVWVPPPLPTHHLPDTDDALVRNAVQAHVTKTAVKTTRADDTPPNLTREEAIQGRIDAYRERALMNLHVPKGGDAFGPQVENVRVKIPFRMVPSEETMRSTSKTLKPYVDQELRARANAPVVEAVAYKLGIGQQELLELKAGRGSPETIERFTQALINARRLPGGPDPLDVRVRIMMCDHGIGLDCAGFVQQAFLASRAESRGDAGLKPILDEDLTQLASRGFKRVSETETRAGDLFILAPPSAGRTGHTMLVRGTHMAAQGELPSQIRAMVDPSRVRVIEVDSSWGNGANPAVGGVARDRLYFDECSQRWLALNDDRESWSLSKTPYHGDPIDGVYRPASEP